MKNSSRSLKISTIVNDFHVEYLVVKEKYPNEMLASAFIVLTFVIFMKGRSTNDNLANTWSKGVKEAISANFAHFGTLKDPSLALE